MTRAFDRVLIVMFENQYRSYTLGDRFLDKLRRAGMDLTNSFGSFHPSQTNYIASLAGEVCAVTNDTPPARPLPQKTLVDLLEAKGCSWKAYMEALPAEAWNPVWADSTYPADQQPTNEYPDTGQPLARYFRKHNAFASFHTIQGDKERWGKIVDENQFWADVKNGALPEYAWFTPDIWNDGHYLQNTHFATEPRVHLIPQLSSWLEYVFFGNVPTDKVNGDPVNGVTEIGLNLNVDLLLSDPKAAWKQSNVPEGTLIIVTFDEADYDAEGYDTNYDGPNQIYTVLLGDMIEPGTVCDLPLNHYGIIRTIERNFDLGDLGKNDVGANWVRPLWNEQFAWQPVQTVGREAPAQIALADYAGSAWMSLPVVGGGVDLLQLKDGDWKAAGANAQVPDGAATALTADGDGLLLAWVADGALQTSRSGNGFDWSTAEPLPGAEPAGAVALHAFDQGGETGVAAAWVDARGAIWSALNTGGQWAAPVSVGQYTDGTLQLCQMGGALYLVYKERNTRNMRLTSLNLAPFNAFQALNFDDKPDPVNDTSLKTWAPADMPVGNFAKKFAALENEYRADGAFALAAVDGEMRLVHRGAYADTPQTYTESFSLTGIFTAAQAYGNGYGTIAQAGWTAEAPLDGVTMDADSAVAMVGSGETYVLVWQEKNGGALSWRLGGYSA